MEAFVTLVRDMDSSELRSVYNTLCEKGLRVHVEMEEFVEKPFQNLKEQMVGLFLLLSFLWPHVITLACRVSSAYTPHSSFSLKHLEFWQVWEFNVLITWK